MVQKFQCPWMVLGDFLTIFCCSCYSQLPHIPAISTDTYFPLAILTHAHKCPHTPTITLILHTHPNRHWHTHKVPHKILCQHNHRLSRLLADSPLWVYLVCINVKLRQWSEVSYEAIGVLLIVYKMMASNKNLTQGRCVLCVANQSGDSKSEWQKNLPFHRDTVHGWLYPISSPYQSENTSRQQDVS